MKRILRSSTATLIVGVVVLALGGTGLAAWLLSGSGDGTASAQNMPSGPRPEVAVVGRSVTVTWDAATFPGTSTEVAGYEVLRYTAAEGGSGTTLTCENASSLECEDVDVATGDLYYAIVPRQGSWRGAEGPRAQATVAAPSLDLATSALGQHESRTVDGSVANFKTGGQLAFRLDTATGTALSATLDGVATPTTVDRSGSVPVEVTVPSGLSIGSHTIVAVWTKVGSADETAATGSFEVTAPPAAQPLTSGVTFPADGGVYNGTAWGAGCTTVGLCGTAGGADLAKVQISVRRAPAGNYFNGTAFNSGSEQWHDATGTTAWRFSLALSSLSDGLYTVRSRALDASGAPQSAPDSVTFRIDATGMPAASITEPVENAQVTGTITVKASVSDTGSGISTVQFQRQALVNNAPSGDWVDMGAVITNASPVTASTVHERALDTDALSDRRYQVRAQVTDAAGNTVSSSPVSFRIKPRVTNLALVNAGTNAQAGAMNAGDKIVMTFSQPISPASFCRNWSTSAATFTATADLSLSQAQTLSVGSLPSGTCGTGGNNTFALGPITLEKTYVAISKQNQTAVFDDSTLTYSVSDRTLTLTLGARGGDGTPASNVDAGTVTFTPSSALVNADAASIVTTPATAVSQRF